MLGARCRAFRQPASAIQTSAGSSPTRHRLSRASRPRQYQPRLSLPIKAKISRTSRLRCLLMNPCSCNRPGTSHIRPISILVRLAVSRRPRRWGIPSARRSIQPFLWPRGRIPCQLQHRRRLRSQPITPRRLQPPHLKVQCLRRPPLPVGSRVQVGLHGLVRCVCTIRPPSQRQRLTPTRLQRSQKENAPKYSERLKGVGVPTSALSADAIAAGLAWRQGHDVQTAASSDATVRQRPTQDPLMVNAQLPTTATSQAPSPAPTEVNGVRMTVNANPAQYRVTSRVADHISSSGFIHDARRLPLSGTAAPTAPMARPLLPTHFFGPGAHMAAVSAPTHVNYGNPFAPAAGGSQLSAEPQLPAYMNGPRQAPVAPAAPFTSPAGIQSGHETPGRRQSRRASQGTASAEKSKRTASDMEDDGSDDSQQSPSARAAKRRKSGSANGSAGRRT